MPSRRSLTALSGLLALLVVAVVLVATASTGSSLGRARAHVGDAAASVGGALTVPSPEPVPTVAPVSDADVTSRIAAEQVRRLITSAQGHLDAGGKPAAASAVLDYNAAIKVLTDVRVSTDPTAYEALYADMADLKTRLVKVFPAATPAPAR